MYIYIYILSHIAEEVAAPIPSFRTSDVQRPRKVGWYSTVDPPGCSSMKVPPNATVKAHRRHTLQHKLLYRVLPTQHTQGRRYTKPGSYI